MGASVRDRSREVAVGGSIEEELLPFLWLSLFVVVLA
jgi:hypothetical protein